MSTLILFFCALIYVSIIAVVSISSYRYGRYDSQYESKVTSRNSKLDVNKNSTELTTDESDVSTDREEENPKQKDLERGSTNHGETKRTKSKRLLDSYNNQTDSDSKSSDNNIRSPAPRKK